MTTNNQSNLAAKHRPNSFEGLAGQAHITGSLQKVLDGRRSQTFLFSGPAGTGKTTLARIAAGYVGCEPRDINEFDGATYSGIENIRELQTLVRSRPIGGGDSRALILDECHGLSSKAWDTLLKITEEPSAHMHWFFCTTNLAKVPKTIRTRCTAYVLKLVDDKNMERVLARIIKKEGMPAVPDGVMQMIIREAHGSPRQAITNLGIACDCKTSKEAQALLHSAADSDPAIELCRFLLAGGSWAKAMAIVAKFTDESPESVRYMVVNYFGAVAKGAKDNAKAGAALEIIDAFSQPYNPSEGIAPLLLSIGRVLIGQE